MMKRIANGRRSETSTSLMAFLLLGVVSAIAFAGPAEEDESSIAPDPAFQSAIAELVSATDEAGRAEALDRLRQLNQASQQTLVRQLVLYSSQARSTRDGMAAGVIMQRLAVPDMAIVRSLIPLLDAPDESLRKSSRNVLTGFEDRAADQRPNFSIYRDLIADELRQGEQPPDALIRYLYDADPGQAMLTMMRAHQLRQPDEIKPILWAEHTIADVLWKQRYGFLGSDQIEPQAGVELAKLARHKAWWVRLYAAEVMRQHPAFRREDLAESLSSDGHALVQEAATAVRKEE